MHDTGPLFAELEGENWIGELVKSRQSDPASKSHWKVQVIVLWKFRSRFFSSSQRAWQHDLNGSPEPQGHMAENNAEVRRLPMSLIVKGMTPGSANTANWRIHFGLTMDDSSINHFGPAEASAKR